LIYICVCVHSWLLTSSVGSLYDPVIPSHLVLSKALMAKCVFTNSPRSQTMWTFLIKICLPMSIYLAVMTALTRVTLQPPIWIAIADLL